MCHEVSKLWGMLGGTGGGSETWSFLSHGYGLRFPMTLIWKNPMVWWGGCSFPEDAVQPTIR